VALGFLGSPSIRVNGLDVEGRQTANGALGCRIYDGGASIPPEDVVEAAVTRARKEKQVERERESRGATKADQDHREVVKKGYQHAARAIVEEKRSTYCGGGSAGSPARRGIAPISRDLYSPEEAAAVPADAIAASFGCGNPTALAELREGEIVLDLGSGGGLDVLLSARRVGPTGKAYGLDMTLELLELARSNQQQAGATNVEFLHGTIESIPLPESSVDVVISNCVINLSADKDQVLREAFRVLKPGGRLAVSDLVLRREVPVEVRSDLSLWTGCVAGSLLEADYRARLDAAGFGGIEVEPTRVYDRDDAGELAKASSCCSSRSDALIEALEGALMSAFIRATKPVG
jgi:SAM-dependent methyltransferase